MRGLAEHDGISDAPVRVETDAHLVFTGIIP